MGKRGKTPSLIGGGARASKFVTAGKRRQCKRCDCDIPKGTRCAEVGIPGSLGSRTYCLSCFSDMIEQSRRDLDRLEQQARA